MELLARAAIAVAGLAALAAIVPVAAQASTAPHGAATGTPVKKAKTYKVKARKLGKPKFPTHAGPEGIQIKGCLPPLVTLDREALCVVLPAGVTVVELQDNAPDGNAETYTFGVQLEIGLSATSAKLELQATVVGLSMSGDAPELLPTLTISSVCGHPCHRHA